METWRVVLDSPKPWILAHCETRSALLDRWKLGGSFWIVRNLGFERIAKLRGANLGVRKLGTYAHEKLGVCNRAFCETSGVYVETSGVLFRCVGVVCALVALSVYSSLSFFSAFVHLGDFCRGEGTQKR